MLVQEVMAAITTLPWRNARFTSGGTCSSMGESATETAGLPPSSSQVLVVLVGEAAAAGRNIALGERSARGRDGITGARRAGYIGFASLRGGTAAGDHSVMFAGPFERLTLSPHAEDRTLFAQGALKAALWANGKKPGFYTMADVLGLGDT